MSSANLPRPRKRRSSSLRGSDAPTQGLLPFFFLSATIIAPPPTSRARAPAPLWLRQRCLQTVDQFLNLFLPQWFEQTARNRGQPSENLRFALPVHFCARSGAVRACRARSNPATTVTLPPATAPCPLYCARRGRSPSASSIFTFGGTLDVGNAHIHLDGEMGLVLNRESLKLRQQRRKSIRVGQKVVNLLRVSS